MQGRSKEMNPQRKGQWLINQIRSAPDFPTHSKIRRDNEWILIDTLTPELLVLAKKQGYNETDLTERKCKRCGCYVLCEKFIGQYYPYYCVNCDENMFTFETVKSEK